MSDYYFKLNTISNRHEYTNRSCLCKYISKYAPIDFYFRYIKL